ncbi:MAG TPA: acyltransferase, partial [Nitrospirae bacterium]|nr:acyltransferase [Nitrospirota bacterium]
TANRIGIEHRKKEQSLTFIGKSEIVSPKGEILVRAPEDEEALMVTDIDLTTTRDKSLNPFNNIFKDRRPEQYGPFY